LATLSEQVGASMRWGNSLVAGPWSPLPGASILAGFPVDYPSSEASLCPCLSPRSVPGCIRCVVHFPVIPDEFTIARER